MLAREQANKTPPALKQGRDADVIPASVIQTK
jgi:hypothetical protein